MQCEFPCSSAVSAVSNVVSPCSGCSWPSLWQNQRAHTQYACPCLRPQHDHIMRNGSQMTSSTNRERVPNLLAGCCTPPKKPANNRTFFTVLKHEEHLSQFTTQRNAANCISMWQVNTGLLELFSSGAHWTVPVTGTLKATRRFV